MSPSRSILAAGVVWAVVVSSAGVAAAVIGVGDDEDRLAPYVDALSAEFADAMDVGERGDEPLRCIVRAMLEDIGLPALEATGLSPEELARAEGVVASGLLPEAPDAEVIEGAAASCRFDRWTAEMAVEEMHRALPGGDTALDADERACIVDGIVDDARFVRSIALGLSGGASLDATDVPEVFAGAMAGCPSVLVDLVVYVFEDRLGLELDDSTRACLEDAIGADPDAVARAILGDTDAREARNEVMEACITGGLAGLPFD